MSDIRVLLATALERAAFSAPGPDGRMDETTAADVEAILKQGGQGEAEEAGAAED